MIGSLLHPPMGFEP
uniref:Protein AIG1 n=1 Tax=Rhizophora mucronata TaxID=61149 RepID=A0A2P2PL94_RHIMU